MSPDNSRSIKRVLIAAAEYYDKTLSETQLAMYAADLADLTPDEVERGFQIYRKDPKNTRFPLPAALREIIAPKVDDLTVATDLTMKIIAAIKYHGYTWNWPPGGFSPYRSWDEAVHAELGELAYEVIQRIGGWKYLHDWYFDSNDGQFIPQLRERILSIMKLSRAAQLHRRPTLPEPERHIRTLKMNGPMSIGQILAEKKVGETR